MADFHQEKAIRYAEGRLRLRGDLCMVTWTCSPTILMHRGLYFRQSAYS